MRTIRLGGGYSYLEVTVDDEDYDLLVAHSWCRLAGQNTDYAVARIEGRIRQMHRVILNAGVGQRIDHADGNGLNNSRSNLRLVTNSENQQNKDARRDSKSGYKGVWRLKRDLAKPWTAQIKCQGTTRHLGYFETPELAAEAYNTAAVELFGEFARLNRIEEITA